MQKTLLLLFLFSILPFSGFTQEEKGRSLFVGVNAGTKIGNRAYAYRYSGAYGYFGSDQTQLEYTLYTPVNYNIIRDQLGGFDFVVPFDAYSRNIRYTPQLLTGVTLGYQVSPKLQMTVDANISKLKVKDVFTIQVLDGGVQTEEQQFQLGNIYGEESRFDGRFNIDYIIGEERKTPFIIGGSVLYSFWRMDEHFAEFRGHVMPLFTQFQQNPNDPTNVTRGAGLGFGLNLGIQYRINPKILSQIMYQPYHSTASYGIATTGIRLQHDFIVRILWK